MSISELSAVAVRSAERVDACVRHDFLGAPVDCLAMAETLSAIDAAMQQRKLLHHVCLNVTKFVAMRSDAELARDVRSSDLVSIDGMGIVWAARLLGIHVPERVAGIDLLENVLALCATKGYRPYFLGAQRTVLNAAVAQIRRRHPSLVFAGSRDGYFAPEQEDALVAAIRQSGADCLFVGMPTPLKERFLFRHRNTLGVPFVMGVGGSFDVLAGHVRRAPRLLQKMGLEWLCRLLQEPRRLGPRHLKANVAFAAILLKALLKRVTPTSPPRMA
jgi:N-acetylglucosaminyldiphosphoundecaprenol N-acetyl-beta-D-mannosaminyltransferase